MERLAFRFGMAWVGLCGALAVHVADEALTGFLEVYNPAARTIRKQLPFLPLPVFTFRVWLTLLVLAVCLLCGLSVFAFRGARWMVPLACLYGILMLVNGLAHLAGSVYLGRLAPGVYSAPLLLAGSIFLLVNAHRVRSSWRRPDGENT